MPWTGWLVSSKRGEVEGTFVPPPDTPEPPEPPETPPRTERCSASKNLSYEIREPDKRERRGDESISEDELTAAIAVLLLLILLLCYCLVIEFLFLAGGKSSVKKISQVTSGRVRRAGE
jgi:hypothetical protein